MKIKCPKCEKEHEIEEYNFEWSSEGYKGKCPNCKTKLTRTKQARGLIRNPAGQLVRSAGRRKKK